MNISMKRIRAAGFAVLLLSPSAVLAQEAGSPPPAPAGVTAPAPPTAQQQAAMRNTHAQLERLHLAARTQMLAALTPQHRTQFAAIVGNLAVEAVPDRAAAARQIDALLSAREAGSILATAASERQSAESLMQAARAQFESSLSPAERTQMQARMQHMEAMRPSRAPAAPDAGEALLHTALGGGAHMHGGPHMLGGPAGPGPQ